MYFRDWEKKQKQKEPPSYRSEGDIVVWITKQLPYLDNEQWRRLRNELLLETKRRYEDRANKRGIASR